MAFMECHFYSDTLGMASSMNVILPEKGSGPFPCLYLLHGLSDDHSVWARRTSVERYAQPFGLAVVMPNVHRSFYTNMASGYRYWDFVSRELPEVAHTMFRLSGDRERTFVAGLSMGGYGAFKLALNQPGRFAAAGSFSGVLDMAARVADKDASRRDDLDLVYGPGRSIKGTENDLLAAAEKAAAGETPAPVLYQCCGTEDFLYQQNLVFRDKAQQLGLDLTYDEGTGGHEWSYWDRHIRAFLELLSQRNMLKRVGER